MEGMDLLHEMIRQDDFFVKIDLKDAYLTVPIHHGHRKYFQIRWADILYQFRCLPFGLASAPWIFTKLLKPVITFLRKQGLRSIIYLDDILILNASEKGAGQEYQLAISVLEICGFLINLEKSVGVLSQVMEYLGLIIDSRSLSLGLRREKIVEIRDLCLAMLRRESVSLREIAKILGNLVWAVKAIPFAQAHYRGIQMQYIEGCKTFGNSLQSTVSLDSKSKQDLVWWATNGIRSNGKPMSATEPDLIIYSDASLSGWGAVFNEVSTRGPWTLADQKRHINELELLAALNALKAFTSRLRNSTIRLMLDNFTAVHYINKSGGTKSPALSAITAEIVAWCEERTFSIRAVHLPGILNFLADRQSRMQHETSDWKLQESTFQQNMALWDRKIDLFAANWNRQLDLFVSWKPQPEATAVDAFTLSWNELPGYAFPPFNLIFKCLSKIRKDKAELVLVAPVWQAQPWWPTIMELACQPPRIIRSSKELLRDPLGNPHPLLARGSLLLAAWMLSGVASKTKDFRTKWSSFLWEQTVKPHQLLTRAPGTVGSVEFLTDLHKEGKAYRSINVFRSMLSSTLDRIDGFDVGKHPLIVKLMKGIFHFNPPQPKYNGFWDVGVVLSYLESLGPNESLELKLLSSKFIFSLTKLNPDSNLCSVLCLERYIHVTKPFRNGSSPHTLALSVVSPHAPVGASSIGRWIKGVLSDAGVDTTIYSAHSTSGASASKAVNIGRLIESILRTGGWASKCVFSKHYSRPISTETFGSRIISETQQ
ncbi:Uncharacterized protein APZ42_021816 [Daphnia magna]|uniref:Reverse transcriptase domain-containing protein n=1 Tax=Daphnia magna TaxID=35525 RepID=A0A164W9J4_9CRUS|nr:Uncharacterized protein APZ42_021816 [Daphnia magna]